MNRLLFRFNLTLFTAIAALLLGISSLGCVQDKRSTLSGRVLDINGRPIADLRITVIPNTNVLRHILKRRDNRLDTRNREIWKTGETDAFGKFSITDIVSGPISVRVDSQTQVQGMPHFEPNYNIISMKVEKTTFYPSRSIDTITFAIEPGEHIENVEVTVRRQMYIRGQVVFADGTPLANGMIHYNIQRRDFDEGGSGSSSGGIKTDDTGYFVRHVYEPGFYTVEVEFQGLSVTLERFSLGAGQWRDGLVFKLDSPPIPINPTPNRVAPDTRGVWVLNPENGHSYKRVNHCMSWKDAQAKAVAEDAYLVSINNAAEQQWLLDVFGITRYWIGLNDVAKEGEWQWTSGEPVTYTNWAPSQPINTDKGDEDYVFTEASGEWFNTVSGNIMWPHANQAIIEKDNLPAKTRTKEQ